MTYCCISGVGCHELFEKLLVDEEIFMVRRVVLRNCLGDLTKLPLKILVWEIAKGNG
jgi:hypothetical protein